MDLQRIKHSFSSHDDLFWLLLNGEGANEGGHLLCRLPLGQLAQTLLPRPYTGVDDLEKQLSSARIEDEDGTIDWLGGEVTFKCLQAGEERK